jgi:hypothetical protein
MPENPKVWLIAGQYNTCTIMRYLVGKRPYSTPYVKLFDLQTGHIVGDVIVPEAERCFRFQRMTVDITSVDAIIRCVDSTEYYLTHYRITREVRNIRLMDGDELEELFYTAQRGEAGPKFTFENMVVIAYRAKQLSSKVTHGIILKFDKNGNLPMEKILFSHKSDYEPDIKLNYAMGHLCIVSVDGRIRYVNFYTIGGAGGKPAMQLLYKDIPVCCRGKCYYIFPKTGIFFEYVLKQLKNAKIVLALDAYALTGDFSKLI